MQSQNAPWRCLQCKQLRKHSASHCQTCHLPWQTAMDRTYIHGIKQSAASSQAYQQQWNYHGGHQYYQGEQSPRSQKSPRRYQSPKKKTPRGGKGKDSAGFGPPMQYQPYQHLQPQGYPAMPPLPPPSGPPPWAHPGAPTMMPMMNMMPMQNTQAPPPQPCNPVPVFAPLAVPAPSVPTGMQEQVPNELLNYLQVQWTFHWMFSRKFNPSQGNKGREPSRIFKSQQSLWERLVLLTRRLCWLAPNISVHGNLSWRRP